MSWMGRERFHRGGLGGWFLRTMWSSAGRKKQDSLFFGFWEYLSPFSFLIWGPWDFFCQVSPKVPKINLRCLNLLLLKKRESWRLCLDLSLYFLIILRHSRGTVLIPGSVQKHDKTQIWNVLFLQSCITRFSQSLQVSCVLFFWSGKLRLHKRFDERS